MIDGQKVLALLPARGGSKGVPRKNVLKVTNRPLIDWSIQAAVRSKYVDRIIVSTDDEEIEVEARRCGAEVPFLRPAHLASDTATSEDVVSHVLDTLGEEYDLVVLLQPTSPLRTDADVDRCIELCMETGRSAVSIVESDKTPAWMFALDDKGRLASVLNQEDIPTRRQEARTVYALNGAVYVVRVDEFRETRRLFSVESEPYIMPKERSLDIDTPFDFEVFRLIAEETFRKRSSKENQQS